MERRRIFKVQLYPPYDSPKYIRAKTIVGARKTADKLYGRKNIFLVKYK